MMFGEALSLKENVDKLFGTVSNIVDMYMCGIMGDGILKPTVDMLGSVTGATGTGAKKVKISQKRLDFGLEIIYI